MDFCEVIKKLYKTVEKRKKEMPEDSYTASLFKKGEDKILQKVGEEAVEVILAFKSGEKEEMVYEISDLIYHLTVAMVNQGLTFDDIALELKRRMG